MLYNTLLNYVWSQVYNNTSVDSAVISLSTAMHFAMNQSVPRGFIRNTKYPNWCVAFFSYYIRNKNYFQNKFKNKNTDYFCYQFSKYHKLFEITVKSDRLAWYKAIDDYLKKRPTNFWKYICTFQCTMIQLHVDRTCIDDPGEFAEAFAKHFCTACSHILPPLTPISVFVLISYR
jgi:hypothetical protein